MDRATKLIVLISTGAALAVQVVLVSRAWPPITALTIAAFALSFAFAVWFDDLAVSGILLLTYVVPVTYLLVVGHWDASLWVPWLAALAGAILPKSARRAWTFPRSWKAALIFWALCVALCWPIVALRELDFTTALFNEYGPSNSSVGISPPVAVLWIASAACVTQLVLLLLDWLLIQYGDTGNSAFERRIVGPLLVGCVVASAVAMFQAFGDVAFLNPTVFAATGRTAGTMLDGNVYGTIAALWLPFAVTTAIGLIAARARWALACCAIAIALGIGLWSSGSRTALLSGVIGLLFVSAYLAPSFPRARRPLLGFAAAATLLVALIVMLPGAVSGPVQRIRPLLPGISVAGARRALDLLWFREGYGTAALSMIRAHPFAGIGIGTFNMYLADVSRLSVMPDNAQNWLRHQLAELGLLGSLGLIAWTAVFFWTVVCARTPNDSHATTGAVKGAIVGFTFASLWGMPAQDPAAAFTFIVFLFWLATLKRTAKGGSGSTTPRIGTVQWAAVGTTLLVFLVATAYVGWTDMRPPFRAARAGWPYQYGFFDVEGPPEKQFRWTSSKAVDVFPVKGHWLKLVIGGAVPPDAAQRPVELSVWRGRTLILRMRRRDAASVTRYVRVPEGGGWAVLQIDVDRTWRPSNYGSTDTRALGVTVEPWTWVSAPPAGAITIQ